MVLAFLPEASIGTAIEMFEAYEHGRIVVVVSPMHHNWAMKFLSHLLYTDLEEFEQAVSSGEFGRRLDELVRRSRASRQSADDYARACLRGASDSAIVRQFDDCSPPARNR